MAWSRRPSEPLDLLTGTPYWVRRAGLIASYPPLLETTSADVVVVGAGVTGASLAHELAITGARVVVLDRRDAASGSSAASTGLLLYDTDTSLASLTARLGPDGARRVYELGVDAIDRLEKFCLDEGPSAAFARRPVLYLASRRRDVGGLREEFASRQALGLDVAWLERDRLGAHVAGNAPAAIWATGTAEVDCYRLTHHLLRAAMATGARVFDRTAVESVSGVEGAFVVRTSRGLDVASRHVVWATGYEGIVEAPPRARLASTWVVVTEPVDAKVVPADRFLLWETARPYIYARWTDDDRLLVGGEDEPCAECHRSPWWFATKTRRLLDRARGLFPAAPFEAGYAWAGTFSLTDDGLPIIAERPGAPGQWLALGYGGNGITFGAIAARLIADALAGRPSSDLALFGAG